MSATPLAVRAAAALELRKRDRERWRDDPAAFARERFGLTLTPDQVAVLESVRDHPRTFVRAANGVGKTYVASVAVCWFLECQPDAIVLTTAPSWSQVTELLWKEIRARHGEAAQVSYPLPGVIRPSDPRWTLSDVSFAIGKSTDSEDRFKGQHAKHLLIVLDEGPGVPEFIYRAASTMLKGRHARLLTIGNPTVLSGSFYDAFHSKAAINATLAIPAHTHPNVTAALDHLGIDWQAFKTAPYGTHTLPDDWEDPIPGAVSLTDLDLAKIEYGVDSPAWAVVVEGAFPPAGERSLISLEWLSAARNPDRAVSQLPDSVVAPLGRYAGLDVARYGSDRSALVLVEDERIISVETWHGAELSHTAGKAAEAIRAGYTVNIDTGGLGAAIPSHLKQAGFHEGRDFHEVNFGSAPTRHGVDRYPNRRSQLWGDAADMLRCGVIDATGVPVADWRQIVGELSSVEYELDAKGRRVVEPKEKIKKRLGRSPDVADALCLALHRPPRTVSVDTSSHAGPTITGGIMQEIW